MSKTRQSQAGQTLWTKGKVAELIKLYREHECLWNHYIESYKDKAKRQDAVNDICHTLGISTLAYGKKIHNLRNQFNSELKKLERCLDQAGDADNSEVVAQAAKNCRWAHFDSLQFLAKVIEPRPAGFEASLNKSGIGGNVSELLKQQKEEHETIVPDEFEIEVSTEECDESQAEEAAVSELQNYMSEDDLEAGESKNVQKILTYTPPQHKRKLQQQQQEPQQLRKSQRIPDKTNLLPIGSVVEVSNQSPPQATPVPVQAVAQATIVHDKIKQEEINCVEERDRWEIFGIFVANEIRNLSSERLRSRLKRKILHSILEVTDEAEYERSQVLEN